MRPSASDSNAARNGSSDAASEASSDARDAVQIDGASSADALAAVRSGGTDGDGLGVSRIPDDFLETVGPTVVVLERETGRVLPDAGLWWLARDEVATAELPWHPGAGLLFVRHGERQALRVLETFGRQRLVIRLARHFDLIVRTSDPNGRPLGHVPIVLTELRVPLQPVEPLAAEPAALFRARDGPDGEARVAHGSTLLDAQVDADGLSNHAVVAAARAFPCRDRLATPIDPRHDGIATVELLPPMATVRLRAEIAARARRSRG